MSGVDTARVFMYYKHGTIVVDDDGALWVVDDAQDNKVKIAANVDEFERFIGYAHHMKTHVLAVEE